MSTSLFDCRVLLIAENGVAGQSSVVKMASRFSRLQLAPSRGIVEDDESSSGRTLHAIGVLLN